MKTDVISILVVTERDDCQGPMAAAYLRDYSPRLRVVSAGRRPASSLHPLVVPAMDESLIDMGGYVPRALADFDVGAFSLVVKWGEGVEVPSDLASFRVLRDAVKNEAFLWYRRHCMGR